MDFVVKEDKCVWKLRDGNGNFIKSIITPTSMYPLHNDSFSVFTDDNTKIITDKKVINIINKLSFQKGRCYSNSEKIINALKGYNAKAFAGWFFMPSHTIYPIHHSWVVLDDNCIIDMSNDLVALQDVGVDFSVKYNDQKKLYDDLAECLKKINVMKNADRCYPFGKTHGCIYIGCECEPNEAKKDYNSLIALYPNHEIIRTQNNNGMNFTQYNLSKRGVF